MKKPLKFICILCVLTLIFSLIFTACDDTTSPENTDKNTESQNTESQNTEPQNTELQNTEPQNTEETNKTEDSTSKVAMKLNSITVTKNMMSYFFRTYYINLINNVSNQYANELGNPYALMGIDPEKSLKEQSYYDGKTTWYDYVLEITKNTVSQYLVYAAAAKDAGVELDDADKKAVDSAVNKIILSARSSMKLSADTSDDLCCTKAFGDGVTKSDVWDAVALKTLSQKMSDLKQKEIKSSIKNDNDRVNATYNQNPNLFHYADYLYFSFTVEFDDVIEELYPGRSVDELSSEQTETAKNVYKEKIEEARKNAEELAKKKTVEEYNEFVASFTDSDKNTLYQSIYYGDSEDLIENWVFDSARQPFDSKVFEEGDGADGNTVEIDYGSFYADVLLLIKPSYKLETLSRDFAYLIFETESSAKNAIETLKNIDKLDKDSFLKLAENNDNPASAYGFIEDCAVLDPQSDKSREWLIDKDPNANPAYACGFREPEKNGLITTMFHSQVDKFNEWLFDTDLAEGSYTKTPFSLIDGSYMVALYAKQNSTPEWKYRVIDTIFSQDFVQFENDLIAKFQKSIQSSDSVLSNLEDKGYAY